MQRLRRAVRGKKMVYTWIVHNDKDVVQCLSDLAVAVEPFLGELATSWPGERT